MSEVYNAEEKDDLNETDEDISTINRRRFVRALGVAGGTGAFGVGVSSGHVRGASHPLSTRAGGRSGDDSITTSDAEANPEDVLNSSEVRSILHELDGENLNAEQAEASEISISEEQFTVTDIPGETGSLSYMEAEDGTMDAVFYFEERAKYPRKQYDAPGSIQGALVGKSDGTVFVRPASKRERKRLANRLRTPRKDIFGYTTSEINDLRAVIVNDNASRLETYSVGQDIERIGSEPSATAESSDVSTQADPCDAYGFFCYQCITGAPICGVCGSLCFSGVGTVACAICLVHTCGITGSDCYTCVNCAT